MPLYPSWIEISVADLERALRFYRAVFGLDETPRYDAPPAEIVLLLPSAKEMDTPGVSLVRSPSHVPGVRGMTVNFHLGDYAALDAALDTLEQQGGQVLTPLTDEGDGQRYCLALDSEGNRLSLSAYETPAIT
jgi:hypothetical protein